MRIAATVGSVGFLVLTAAVAVAQPGGAQAKDPLESFYGNTMESRHQDGQVFRVYFNRDHTYKVLDKDGKIVRDGTYTFDNNKLCFYVKEKVVECPGFRADLKMGETWDSMTNGKHDYLTLKAGR